MPSAVQITLTMDNSGVVTVANQTGDVLRKITPPSTKIKQEFDGIESAERRAHITGTLFTRLTGFEMPRAMETVISRSRILGPLLAGMFNATIVATAGFAVVEFGKKLGGLFDAIVGNTEAVKEMGKAAADAAQDAFWNPKTLSVAIQHMGELQQRVDKLRKVSSFPKATETNPFNSSAGGVLDVSPEVKAGKELEDIETRRRDLIEQTTKLQVERNALLDAETSKANEAGKQGFALLEQQKQDYLNSRTLLVLKTQDHDSYIEQVTLKERQFQGERMALERESANQTIALRHQVAEESVQGMARVHMVESDAIEDINRKERETLITHGDAQTQRVLIHKRAVEQIKLAENDLLKQSAEANLFAEQRANAFLTGSQKIIADAQYEKDSINAGLDEVIRKYGVMSIEAYNAWKNAQIKIQAITDSTDMQLLIQQQQLRDKTIDLQQQAAIGALPEWQRAEATIRLEHDKTYQELNRLELQDVANFAQYEQQKAAADQLMNDHLRDEHKRLTEQLGSDLQSVFDDITSGNIGKRILANMEKLFFQILAQWILSLNMMKSAAGSIFGSIVFGPGSTGAGVFGGGGSGGGGSSLLGGLLGGLFGGGNSSEGAKVGFGGAPGSGSMAIPGLVGGTTSGLSGSIAGIGASPSSALVPSASSALTSSTMADALPGLVGGTTSQIGSSSTRTSSFAAGSPLVGLAALAPALVGNFGGKLGQIGGLVSMLAIMGNSQILSALSGGLIGFGVGEGHGGFLGALAGAGSGALTGFLAAGPIGAIIGGLVGLLGGIFGGIFGGSKRKKQANALADNTILPDIAQIITGFDGFQVDSSSAIQQLEQLRSDAQKQLSALKSQGKDVFNQKVGPAIDSAEKHIRDTQAERDRRSAIAFGPPQFDTGGMFSVMRGNKGLAVLHDGEIVMNPTASKKNAAALNAMNQGKTVGGRGDIHLHLYAMDAKSFDGWAKNGGAKMMSRALTRYWDVEGNNG